VNVGRCRRCGSPLDAYSRRDRIYCSTRCRVAAHRARIGADGAVNRGVPSDSGKGMPATSAAL
jgi:hypothetical protein